MFLFKWIQDSNIQNPTLVKTELDCILDNIKIFVSGGLRQKHPFLAREKLVRMRDIISYDILVYGKIVRYKELRGITWFVNKQEYQEITKGMADMVPGFELGGDECTS